MAYGGGFVGLSLSLSSLCASRRSLFPGARAPQGNEGGFSAFGGSQPSPGGGGGDGGARVRRSPHRPSR